jgi:hypothetical protein
MANLDVLSTSNILDKSAFSDASQAHHGNNNIVRHGVGDGSSQLRSSEAVITTMLEFYSGPYDLTTNYELDQPLSNCKDILPVMVG